MALKIKNKAKFTQAVQEVTADKVFLAPDEQTGARWSAAITKALEEIEMNDSIEFHGGILSLVSLASQKVYTVVGGNCSTNCEAVQEHVPCYHSAIGLIVAKYFALVAPIVSTGREFTAADRLRHREMDTAFYRNTAPAGERVEGFRL